MASLSNSGWTTVVSPSFPTVDKTNCSYLPEYELGHVPKLTDFNSVVDLFTFCNLIIMMNVLDLRTYMLSDVPGLSERSAIDILEQHDANSIPSMERYEMAYARGRCWDILRWFFHAYEIFDRDSGEPIDGFHQVAMRYLAHQGSAIIECKRRALKSKLDDGQWFNLKSLSRQMSLCFRSFKDIPATTPPSVDSGHSLAFPDAERYGVRKVVEPEPYECERVPYNLELLAQ
jgi:hypothetical protein